ncbi:hypothetical protein Hamer_G005538, partial [Homarus americanus]
AINAVEGDNKHLSIGPKIFSDLEQAFKDHISSSPVLKSEEECLMSIIPKRRKFLLQPIHLAANLLDPRYRGSHISGEESIDAMEVIHNIATTNPHVDESKVLGELADCRSKENVFVKSFTWKSVKQTSPTSWWNGICCSTQLSRIASDILNLPPTSAAVE